MYFIEFSCCNWLVAIKEHLKLVFPLYIVSLNQGFRLLD